MKNGKRTWLTLLGVVAVAGLTTVLVRKVTAGDPTAVRPGDRATAARVVKSKGGIDERRLVPRGRFIVGNGIVEPARRETRLASEVAGRVTRVLVREGDWVKAGQVVMELARGAERAALAVAGRQLALARQELRRIHAGLRPEERQALAAEAGAAAAKAVLARRLRKRTDYLARNGATSANERDRAFYQARMETARARAARARSAAAMAGARSEDLEVARGRVALAKARRTQAWAIYDRLRVRAPYAAQVLQVKIRPGELYHPQRGDPLLILGDTRRLRVRMDVEERDMGRLRAGAKAFVTADAFGVKRFPGRVVEIGRRMGRKNIRTDDPVERIDTKILEVVISLEETRGLLPGLRVMSYIVPKQPVEAPYPTRPPLVRSGAPPARKAALTSRVDPSSGRAGANAPSKANSAGGVLISSAAPETSFPMLW